MKNKINYVKMNHFNETICIYVYNKWREVNLFEEKCLARGCQFALCRCRGGEFNKLLRSTK